jgi:rare lipoprotein A (peptidoglycan hydrolase)
MLRLIIGVLENRINRCLKLQIKINSFSYVSVLLIVFLVMSTNIVMAQKVSIAAANIKQVENAKQKSFSGNVSWYGVPFHGRKTASGEIFDMNKLTSAHLKLPFFTKVLVEDPSTGKTIIVKVNDRGPYVKTRVMDLSREGARRLGTILRGVAYVDCLVLD